MRFSFPYSHAFPNGRVIVEDDGVKEPRCMVEFADGTTVIAAWRGGKGRHCSRHARLSYGQRHARQRAALAIATRPGWHLVHEKKALIKTAGCSSRNKSPACTLLIPRSRAVSTGRDRDDEREDFSGFSSRPTKRQSSVPPVRPAPQLRRHQTRMADVYRGLPWQVTNSRPTNRSVIFRKRRSRAARRS
jgi:hypothetical protein